ncbi:OsmC family protein [Aestuariibacter salexigens]|uniref:OsmC family protein n=1 Tax=Aestuariibacter salexigens TaxID=226010 RepID=UPI0003F5776C|nr:OsmC family protein [Aestuariibacter salexigens]
MKAVVDWQGDLIFKGTMDDGREIVMDGNDKHISPMQSVLVAVGACSSVDVVEIMKKARQDIQACQCRLEAERADSPPRVFTKIHAHYEVSGVDINEKHLQRAVSLSTEKYCSVMLMLNASVPITTSFSVTAPTEA